MSRLLWQQSWIFAVRTIFVFVNIYLFLNFLIIHFLLPENSTRFISSLFQGTIQLSMLFWKWLLMMPPLKAYEVFILHHFSSFKRFWNFCLVRSLYNVGRLFVIIAASCSHYEKRFQWKNVIFHNSLVTLMILWITPCWSWLTICVVEWLQTMIGWLKVELNGCKSLTISNGCVSNDHFWLRRGVALIMSLYNLGHCFIVSSSA